MIDQEKRRFVRDRAGGKCKICGRERPLNWPLEIRGEAAHRVAKTRWTLKRWGEDVIDDPDNLEWTCAEHNSAVLITYKPVEREALMQRIREKLARPLEEEE